VVNLWEIQIKASLGKLDLRLPLADVHAWIMEREQWKLLPVRWEHIQVLDDLPSPHRDPFDRLLVAQAIAERLTLVSGDSVLRSYPVDILD
jgi:PIN domain nuclease of toxin-antitoxin system